MHIACLGRAEDGQGDILVVGIVIGKLRVANCLKLRKNGWNRLLPQFTETYDMLALRGREVNTTGIRGIILQWSDIYVVRHERIRLPAQETCRVVNPALLFIEHGNHIL